MCAGTAVSWTELGRCAVSAMHTGRAAGKADEANPEGHLDSPRDFDKAFSA